MKRSARTNAATRGGERGFALLLVFLMAAVIGIALFAELPRVAIQAQRAKEQLLVERGEQFKRAIQLFLRANKGTRFPADIDELDRGYNNLRFLRHRYKDPMTGKDEWRIIHMQGGVLTDSLLNKPKDGDKQEESTLGQNISAQAGLGQTADAGQAQPNAMNRRRPSEGGTSGGAGPGDQTGPSTDQGNGPQPGDGSGGTSQQPAGTSGTTGGPVSPFGTASGPPGVPGQFPGQPPGIPGSNSGDGGSSVGSYGSAFGGGSQAGSQSSTPGLPGSQNPANTANPPNGMNGLGQNSAAAGLINQMLTGPRPGGLAGLGQTQGAAMASGMAGVASKMDSEGLMVYNDRTNYKEWEFVYDPTKDRPRQDPRSMLVGNQMGTPSSSTPGVSTQPNQPGGINQSAQTGTNGQTGSNGQTNTNGQTGTSSNTSGGQGGSVDLRPGKK
jgi:hypothetical protein